jgi:hypothetical protein
MAFGQASGPPATGGQMRQLLSLLVAGGHADFRDARGPLGLTQRQAGGRFTCDEADALIARLEAQVDEGGDAEPPRVRSSPSADRRHAEHVALVRKLPSELLAADLQRRDWAVTEP